MRITLLVLLCLVSVITFGQKTDVELNTQNNNTIFTATLTPTRVGNMFEQSILSKVNKRTPEFMDSLDITKIIRFYLSGSHPTATTYNVTWPNKSGTVAFLDDIGGGISKAGNGLGIVGGDSVVFGGGTVTLDSAVFFASNDFSTYLGVDPDNGISLESTVSFGASSTSLTWTAYDLANSFLKFINARTGYEIYIGDSLRIGNNSHHIEFNDSIKFNSTIIKLQQVPNDSDSGAKILLRDATTGLIEKLGIGSGLSVSGGNLNASGSSGDVSKVGTPADNQVGVWTGDGTIEGTSGLTYNGSTLGVTGAITATGAVTGSNLSGTNTGDQTITLTGDVTGSGTGSFSTTIAAGAVDIAMLSATGTADSMSVLYGNNTWRVPSTPLITVSGTTLTLDNTYNGKIINATNASGLTITVPTGLANHFSCGVWRASGAGTVSLSASGTTLNGLGLTLTVEETALSLIQQGQTNEFIVVGAVGSVGGGNFLKSDGSTTLIDAIDVVGSTTNTIKFTHDGRNQSVTNGAGLWLANNTAAADGSQQWSPSLVLEGQGWKTAATAGSQSVKFAQYVVPTQGSSTPEASYYISKSLNGGAYVNLFRIGDDRFELMNNSGNILYLNPSSTGGFIQFGASGAANTATIEGVSTYKSNTGMLFQSTDFNGNTHNVTIRSGNASSGAFKSGDIYIASGTSSGTVGNVGFGVTTVSNWQSMERGIYLSDAITAPTGNPTGGGFLYSDSGDGSKLKWKVPGGTTYDLTATGSGSSNRAMSISLSNPTANITLTNQPNSEQFLSNSNRNIWLVDFTGYDSVKISFRTITGSASANSPRIKLEYATTFGANTTDYSPIGTGATEVSAAISTTNDLTNSGWVALTAAAKGEVYIALMQDGGDGVEDPAIASITVTVK